MPILPTVSRRPTPSLTAKTWAPVSYTTQVVGLTAGKTLMMPQVTLQSGFSTPYYVDEIRFTAYTATYNPQTTDIGDIGAIVSYQLQTGNYFFSQGALGSPSSVPMVLYAPTYSAAGQYEQAQQVTSAVTVARVYTTRRWVLPKPLWMPPGDIVQATVSREASFGTGVPSITAQMTVIGRALTPDSPKPVTRCVPHVGWFAHPLGSGSNIVYSEANAQLGNPFKVPWQVQRLVMTTRDQTTGGSSVETGYGMLEDPTGVKSYANIRLADSLGYKMTGSSLGGFVPLADVAATQNDSAWTFSRPLPPTENFNAAFQINVGSADTTIFCPMISFVGYREEQS